jgi:hypothetical protein
MKNFCGANGREAKPAGYIYDHRLRNIVPDPKKAKLVTQVFDEAAADRRTLIWVSERLAELGIANRNGNRYSKSQVQSFLTNRLYIGVMM